MKTQLKTHKISPKLCLITILTHQTPWLKNFIRLFLYIFLNLLVKIMMKIKVIFMFIWLEKNVCRIGFQKEWNEVISPYCCCTCNLVYLLERYFTRGKQGSLTLNRASLLICRSDWTPTLCCLGGRQILFWASGKCSGSGRRGCRHPKLNCTPQHWLLG